MKSWLLSPPPPRTSVANDEVLRSDQDVQIMKQGKIPLCCRVWAMVAVCTAMVNAEGTGGRWHNRPVNLEMSREVNCVNKGKAAFMPLHTPNS